MIKKNIKLRNRGQITIPREILDQLGAKENDFFTVYYDNNQSKNKKIVLELFRTNEIKFADALEKYIVADFKEKGYDNETIKKQLPIRKEQIENKYLQYLSELEEENDFVDCEDW